MNIPIWSDIMCPFCYIGKKHLEAALAQVGLKEKVTIQWKSFQLDPTLDSKAQPMTTQQYLIQKKGMCVEQYKQVFERLVMMGKEAGIDFAQSGAFIVNTWKAIN